MGLVFFPHHHYQIFVAWQRCSRIVAALKGISFNVINFFGFGNVAATKKHFVASPIFFWQQIKIKNRTRFRFLKRFFFHLLSKKSEKMGSFRFQRCQIRSQGSKFGAGKLSDAIEPESSGFALLNWKSPKIDSNWCSVSKKYFGLSLDPKKITSGLIFFPAESSR